MTMHGVSRSESLMDALYRQAWDPKVGGVRDVFGWFRFLASCRRRGVVPSVGQWWGWRQAQEMFEPSIIWINVSGINRRGLPFRKRMVPRGTSVASP